MAIDIKNLIEFAQRDINAIDSTGDTQTIIDLFRFANRAGSTIYMYDSTSDLPNLLDDTGDIQRLAYVKNRREIYVNRGSWVPQSTAAPPPPPPVFQGTNYGYTSGGVEPTLSNVIDKFSFTSDGNATDVGDLTVIKTQPSGQSSADNGYTSGGVSPAVSPAFTDIIDKFSFATDGNATDVGDLSVPRYFGTGQSSTENGYHSGGTNPLLPVPVHNTIEKFPFATDTNASDIADLTAARFGPAGQSSTENGYTSGGRNSPSIYFNTIDKFPFATDANATDVGDLTVTRGQMPGGQSSSDNGYTSGGFFPGPTYDNTVDKFPFASDANATDVGDLTLGRTGVAGQSSTTNGYSSGGFNSPPSTAYTTIDKFPFTSDANASDVGDLTVTRYDAAGQQY